MKIERFLNPMISLDYGRNYFYISPHGEVHPCDFCCGSVGNILKKPLKNLWSKLVELRKKTEYFNINCANCNLCK